MYAPQRGTFVPDGFYLQILHILSPNFVCSEEVNASLNLRQLPQAPRKMLGILLLHLRQEILLLEKLG